MQDLMNQLTSISWWVGVVFVGVLVNLIAVCLKPRTDRLIGSISSRYHRRNEKKASDRAQQIRILHADPHEQVMLALLINHQRLRSIGFILIGIFSIVLALAVPESFHWVRILAMAYGAFGAVLSSVDVFSSMSKGEILREARETPATESKAIS